MSKGCLVDTHIWIWHLNGDPTLSSKAKKMIDTAAAKDTLYISAISIWEIAMLVQKKKIILNTSCQAWVNKSLSLPGVNFTPLSPEIAIESCDLHGSFHGDPADRILIASAKVENLSLMTRDQKIADYCKQNHIPLIQA